MPTKRIFVISRDGKAAKDFISEHNLTESAIIVKLARDLKDAHEGDKYIIIQAKMPDCYHWRLRPILIRKKMVNVTKFYTHKTLNF